MSPSGQVGIWDIRRTLLRNFRKLTSHPNISHFTIGEKRKGGSRTSEKSIIAYVSRKVRALAEDRCLPDSITCYRKNGSLAGTVNTDVVELKGSGTAFGIRSGHIIRGFDGDLGVTAVSYRNASNQERLLTNAHVVVDVANGTSSLPSFLNRVDGQFYQLGNIAAVSNLVANQQTTHDVAVIAVPDAYEIDHFMVQDIQNDIDEISGISTMSSHDYWFVVNGRTFRCAFPERVVGAVPILVDGVIIPYAECWKLQMTQGASAPGQSGALLCRTSGTDIIACGLIFGGFEPNFILAFPFNKMWNKFKDF